MNNKLVYISGPYSAPTRLAIEYNIGVARDAALWCAEHRIFYFCPHLNSAFFEQWVPGVPSSFYIAMDIRIAWACDALLLLPNWQQSVGSLRERVFFVERKYPIFSYPSEQDKLLSWHREEKE